MTDHTPLVTFDSDNPEFVRGVTIGTVYGVVAARPDLELHFMVGRDNVENLLRIVDALGRTFQTTGVECDSGCHLEFRLEPLPVRHQ